MKLLFIILINFSKVLKKDEELNLNKKIQFIDSLIKYEEFISNKFNNLESFINKKNVSLKIQIPKLKKSSMIKANFYSANIINRFINYFWNKNKKDGLGFLYDNYSEQYYKGHRKNNLKEGFGIIYDKIRNPIFAGNFKNDEKSGKGMEIQKDRIISIGEYKNNYIEDSRIILDINKNIKKFIIIKNKEKYVKVLEYDENGILKNLIENNELKFYKNNYLFYKGDCIIYDNLKENYFEIIKEGKGIEFNQNKSIKFKGIFKNNKKEGYGLEYDNNGELIFSGNYINDLKNGLGIEYLNKEILFIGNYNDDIKIQGFNNPIIDNKIHYYKNKEILAN